MLRAGNGGADTAEGTYETARALCGLVVRRAGAGLPELPPHVPRMERCGETVGGSFRRLRVWQEAFALAVAARPLCSALRDSQQSHLADQLARACTSVHANLAEGDGRRTARDRTHLFLIARGSLQEVESLLSEAALDPVLAPLSAPCFRHTRYTARLLAALLRSLQF